MKKKFTKASRSSYILEFARTTLKDLARGKYKVESAIDWEILFINNLNVGFYYSIFSLKEAQGAFKRNFISQFSLAFIMSGGNVDLFRDWKIKEENSSRILIEATASIKY